jgi:undecaprenyl phosphate N,N'-diacetylbacillosamine 1-phosphate transferase
MKRLFDIIFSLIILIILLLPFILVAILVKFDSNGPIFFMQERLGYGRRKFRVYKFRTMQDKKREIVQVYKNDPEVTRIGSVLRRFKIDELPQLINVLKGEMSVVGPRPCVEFVANRHKLCEERFLDKPGLTSLAGVSGSIYLTWEEKDYYDKFYHDNKSTRLDIEIVFRTILVVFFGEENFLKKPNIK